MRFLKDVLVFCVGAVALIYILNPGAGFLEFLPDNLPLLGNIDEAAAAGILIACVRYFGFDLTRLLERDPRNNTPR
ncbi:MAG: DUF1232 domain-containing protein [Acidobacteria bacterium]|nr:DUF1232 domain-containing protein [Acidobacteriota bacterium]